MADQERTLTEILAAPWTWREDGIRDKNGNDPVGEIGTLDEARALVNAVNAATADERGETAFVIWSNEHRSWWQPGGIGYTSDLSQAGVYTADAAAALCYSAGPTCFDLPRTRDNGYMPAELMMRLEDAQRSLRWRRQHEGMFT
jgi:hypothetical protein